MHYDYNTARMISFERNCGFWQANNRCFFDKIECIKYATALGNTKITYHYFDEIFSSYDWTVEPAETLDDLYKERALQLREKHQYLILMFSGGSDSTNMLESFLRNNIKVDEIVCVFPLQAIEKFKHTFDPRDRSPKNNMFEYTYAALPLLQKISIYHPNIKITVLDYIDETLDIIEKNKFHKLARSNGIINFASGFVYKAFEYAKTLKKASTLVYAIDKPRISYDQKQKTWQHRFLDFHLSYGEFEDDVFNGERPKIEYFYYTPNLPKIVIKQCQLIKRFLETASLIGNPESQLYKELVTEKQFKGKLNIDLDIYSHHDAIKKILYKNWNTEIFQSDKGTSVFHNENFAAWFQNKDLIDHRMRVYHHGQLKEILSGISSEYIDYKNEEPAKLKFYSTKFYEF